MAIAWRFKPGSSLDAFIDGPNKQIAWLLQQALSYDPYHEFWEKGCRDTLLFRCAWIAMVVISLTDVWVKSLKS